MGIRFHPQLSGADHTFAISVQHELMSAESQSGALCENALSGLHTGQGWATSCPVLGSPYAGAVLDLQPPTRGGSALETLRRTTT